MSRTNGHGDDGNENGEENLDAQMCDPASSPSVKLLLSPVKEPDESEPGTSAQTHSEIRKGIAKKKIPRALTNLGAPFKPSSPPHPGKKLRNRKIAPVVRPEKELPAGERGRRTLFKQKTPLVAPKAFATIVTEDSVFYRGTYYQVGDIVSLVDVDGGVYYGQIRGFFSDQYCEKSAVISWLLPTKESPPPDDTFDPATYILGPDEELPRSLDCMELICRAPSDYYRTTRSPYPVIRPTPELGFVWTRLGPHPCTKPSSPDPDDDDAADDDDVELSVNSAHLEPDDHLEDSLGAFDQELSCEEALIAIH